jgi:hypothetical protein
VSPSRWGPGELVARLVEAHGGEAGLPDVLAEFPDGRVVMREVKRRGKDSLSESQHAFAVTAQGVLGGRLDLAVVEWEPPATS